MQRQRISVDLRHVLATRSHAYLPYTESIITITGTGVDANFRFRTSGSNFPEVTHPKTSPSIECLLPPFGIIIISEHIWRINSLRTRSPSIACQKDRWERMAKDYESKHLPVGMYKSEMEDGMIWNAMNLIHLRFDGRLWLYCRME